MHHIPFTPEEHSIAVALLKQMNWIEIDDHQLKHDMMYQPFNRNLDADVADFKNKYMISKYDKKRLFVDSGIFKTLTRTHEGLIRCLSVMIDNLKATTDTINPDYYIQQCETLIRNSERMLKYCQGYVRRD
jgi:hypothetical protein